MLQWLVTISNFNNRQNEWVRTTVNVISHPLWEHLVGFIAQMKREHRLINYNQKPYLRGKFSFFGRKRCMKLERFSSNT
ncbi:unnamed protein product [Blepharisma stoltei]|uniref:Uncharacterized protein n=1 Tax=Blepharisma stoltei TaxID=1481888 RepID=A0AAU9KAS3_9CILI|nr:unnamed protein product [Blepharisma stoltei]